MRGTHTGTVRVTNSKGTTFTRQQRLGTNAKEKSEKNKRLAKAHQADNARIRELSSRLKQGGKMTPADSSLLRKYKLTHPDKKYFAGVLHTKEGKSDMVWSDNWKNAPNQNKVDIIGKAAKAEERYNKSIKGTVNSYDDPSSNENYYNAGGHIRGSWRSHDYKKDIQKQKVKGDRYQVESRAEEAKNMNKETFEMRSALKYRKQFKETLENTKAEYDKRREELKAKYEQDLKNLDYQQSKIEEEAKKGIEYHTNKIKELQAKYKKGSK